MSDYNHRLLFLGFILVYLFLSLVPPTDPAVLQHYGITQERAHLLAFAIAVPTILIWLAAFYGITKLKEYVEAIDESEEGQWFGLLYRGLRILVLGLPLLAALSSYTNYIRYVSPEAYPEVTIAKNYITLLFPLIAFPIIAKGAEGLVRTLKVRNLKIIPRQSLVGVIALSSIYTWLLTASPGPSGTQNAYFMPSILVIFTLAVPYIYVWCKGLLAAYQLYVYKSRVKGRIYRKGLSSLAKGIGTIIILSIMLQVLVSMPTRIRALSLSPILLIVYVMVALSAVGYGLVARGSRKLKQIEEV